MVSEPYKFVLFTSESYYSSLMSTSESPNTYSDSFISTLPMSLTPSPSIRKSTASKLDYLYKVSYVPDESKITSEELPLINPYHTFTKSTILSPNQSNIWSNILPKVSNNMSNQPSLINVNYLYPLDSSFLPYKFLPNFHHTSQRKVLPISILVSSALL